MSSAAATAFEFIREDESRYIGWVFIAGFWDIKYYVGNVKSNSMVSL